MNKLFGIILCVFALFSCENRLSQGNSEKLVEIQDSIKNNQPIVDKYIGVKYDKENKDYYIQKPCDGHIPTIKLTKSTVIDDWGMDEPTIFQIKKYINIDQNNKMLLLSYKWDSDELTDSIIITKVKNGISKWKRYRKYNNNFQGIITAYYVLKNQKSNIKTIKNDCPEEKKLEFEK